MSGILDLLNGDMGKAIIQGVSQQTKASEKQTSDVLLMALPVLTQAMKRNSTSSKGAQGLYNALNDKHDGSILDGLSGLFSGGVNDDVMQDGAKILHHVLGNKQTNVTNALSKQSGVDSGTIAQILQVAAPILMGILGKQSRTQQVSGPSGLESMLGGLLTGNSAKQEQSFLEAILDADNDGSVVDDVAGMLLGNKKKKGGLGSLLGGFLGKS